MGGGVVGSGSLGLRSKHLQPLVVAVRGFAAVVNNTNGAVLEFQADQRRIHISCFTDGRVYQHGSVDEHFLHLAADKAGHVKVMDGHIQEDTAADLYIRNRGRLRVA